MAGGTIGILALIGAGVFVWNSRSKAEMDYDEGADEEYFHEEGDFTDEENEVSGDTEETLTQNET